MIVDITYKGELEKNLNIIVDENNNEEVVHFDYKKGVITFLERSTSKRIANFVENYAGSIKNFDWSKVDKYALSKIIVRYYNLILPKLNDDYSFKIIYQNILEINNLDFMVVVDSSPFDITPHFAVVSDEVATILEGYEITTMDNFDVTGTEMHHLIIALDEFFPEQVYNTYKNAIKYKVEANLNKKRK